MSFSKRVQILYVEARKSAKGNAYQVAQCVVLDEDGIPKVGELWNFNKDVVISTGEFFAEFSIHVDMDRKVTSQLVALNPVPAQAASKVAAK